jgi:hypothetical protein
VEELAMASFKDRDSNFAGNELTRSHSLTIPPQQGKVRGLSMALLQLEPAHATTHWESCAPLLQRLSPSVWLPTCRRARTQRSCPC